MEPNLEKSNTAVTEKPSIFGVITSPVVQFKRLKEKPVIGIPLLIVIILTAVLLFSRFGSILLMPPMYYSVYTYALG